MKCMRILQQFPIADDPSLAGAISAALQRIIAVRTLAARRAARSAAAPCAAAAHVAGTTARRWAQRT